MSLYGFILIMQKALNELYWLSIKLYVKDYQTAKSKVTLHTFTFSLKSNVKQSEKKFKLELFYGANNMMSFYHASYSMISKPLGHF